MVTHLFNGKFLIQLLCKFQVAAAEADPIFAVVLCRLMMRQQRDQADATLYFYLSFFCVPQFGREDVHDSVDESGETHKYKLASFC